MAVRIFMSRLFRALLNSKCSRWVYEKHELHLLVLTKGDYYSTAASDEVEINNRKAIGKFNECEPWHNRAKIIEIFEKRLDEGQIVATIVKANCLACYAWLNPKQISGYFPLVRQEYTFPDNSYALYNVYTHTSFRERGLYKKVLNGIVSWAVNEDEKVTLITAIETNNLVALKVNKKMGFSEVAILSYRRVFGRVTKGKTAL